MLLISRNVFIVIGSKNSLADSMIASAKKNIHQRYLTTVREIGPRTSYIVIPL